MATMRDWQHSAQISTSKEFAVSTVVVPLDGSEAAKIALPVARALADLQQASLHIVYVGEATMGVQETLSQLGLSEQELRGCVLDHTTGNTAEDLLRITRELPDSLIVMCTHAGALSEEAPLGTLAESLLESAPDRLMLVARERGLEPWQLRLLLLAHDGSPSADSAITPTAQLAHSAGANVIALHVAARGCAGSSEPGTLPAPRYIDQPQHEWPSWASEFVDRMLAIGGSAAAINFKLLVTGGQTGSEIAQFARDSGADLVVLPWHGRWDEQRSGAVDAVIRRSGCPVLLLCTVDTSE